MPPVATGLLLLIAFGKRGVLGKYLDRWFGVEIVFTWKAVVLALGVMAFPLLLRSARVNWLLLDSLETTNMTPGLLGDAQRDWLVKLRKERGLLPAVQLAGAFIMSSQGKQ